LEVFHKKPREMRGDCNESKTLRLRKSPSPTLIIFNTPVSYSRCV